MWNKRNGKERGEENIIEKRKESEKGTRKRKEMIVIRKKERRWPNLCTPSCRQIVIFSQKIIRIKEEESTVHDPCILHYH